MVFLKLKLLAEGAKAPAYQTKQAAGADCYACLDGGEGTATWVRPGERKLIPLGFSVALPEGYEMQLRPRSGLALKHGITLLNSPGTIDSDFIGHVKAILINHGDEPFKVDHGDRICQAVIAKIPAVTMNLVEELDDTERGEGGFGHSGKN